MKKILLLGTITLAIVLTGCGQKNQTMSSENPTPNTVETKKDNLVGQVINSAETLKNAILGGQKLECTYRMKNGQNSTEELKSYIDGEKYKSTFEMNGERNVSIMDGETIYNWSEKTKQGSKMSIQCMEDLNKNIPGNDSNNQNNSYESSDEMVEDMMDINCQPASSIDFSVPADVTFTDTCEQMKKTLEQLQNMKGFSTEKTLPN